MDQRKLQLHVEKSPIFPACLCMVISSTVHGHDIHEGNLYMASTDMKTSTLFLQRPSGKNPYLRYPRAQPNSNNPDMGAIRLEVYRGPKLKNFHKRNSYGDFKPDWKPSDILTFKFRHQQLEGENLTSDPAPVTKMKLGSQYRSANQGHSDSVIIKEESRDVPVRRLIPIPSFVRIARNRVPVPSQLKRKRREPSIISVSSDSGEEVEVPVAPRERSDNRRAVLKSVQATSSGSRERGTTARAKLQEAEELLAKEQKRNENLQLQMALCIGEKAKWKKKENEQLAAKIKAEKKLIEQQNVGRQD
ncbi:hypothetical protein BDZ94DRAFT_1252765, partial [Collybia nuda]